jgi:hypothetical protein
MMRRDSETAAATGAPRRRVTGLGPGSGCLPHPDCGRYGREPSGSPRHAGTGWLQDSRAT